jgi:hypothetical protein
MGPVGQKIPGDCTVKPMTKLCVSFRTSYREGASTPGLTGSLLSLSIQILALSGKEYREPVEVRILTEHGLQVRRERTILFLTSVGHPGAS